ncbi:MAG: helix-turn-helix transcriptional regulator [Tissierella sp.]|nr:helix-turn-helix transcriptional regulator [Tissierella sp.]
MSEINIQIGKQIRAHRKKRNLTLDGMSDLIHKSRSTISKYENGEISIDIETLYEIADALHIHVEELLYRRPRNIISSPLNSSPNFFSGVSQFYSYLYDGRGNSLIRCVFDVLAEADNNQYKIMMYMNYKNFEYYQDCENAYWGYIEHYDALTRISLINKDSPIEKANAQILASYLDSNTKWGLFNGFSSRPMMPIAVKMLFSKTRLKEDMDLINQLKVSKDDIRFLRLYNMLSVT